MTALDLDQLTEKKLGNLRVQRVRDRLKHLNILIYGESGVGKTVLAGSASAVADMAPVLFIDVEGGTLSLNAHYPQVEEVRVASWQDIQDAYDTLRRGSEYRTVVLDSLTELQKFSMGGIMRELIAREPDRDPDVPGMREWGKNVEQIRRLVRAFRDLPIHTVFTALVREDRNPRTGLTTKRPGLQGKVAVEVEGFLDIVAHMYLKRLDESDPDSLTRLLLTMKTDDTIAKDRSGKLPPVLERPTMDTIWGFVNGSTDQTKGN